MSDSFFPDKDGDLSYKAYYQGDCKLFRHKILSASYYKEPMGGGTGEPVTPKGDDANWLYPHPISEIETILKKKVWRYAN